MSDADMMGRAVRIPRRRGASTLLVGVLGIVIGLMVGGIRHTAEVTGSPRRCVGMFVATDREQLPADAEWFTVLGEPPCGADVIGWATQGIHRVFDDGSIEVMATPIPPCPGREVVVWIRYEDG
ncbi:MAG: hypothetical protein RLZZ461_555 [Planctomycetota bacterium]|jgi:hypothetical protein